MKKFLKSFYYAAVGILSCIKDERNMRIHICAAFYVLLLMPFYELTKGEKAAVFLCIGSVMAAECFNTAIEAAIDRCSPEKHPLAKLAKDATAGGVLILAVSAAVTGCTIFFDTAVLKKIFEQMISKPAEAVLFVISVIVCGAFIILPCLGKEKKQ